MYINIFKQGTNVYFNAKCFDEGDRQTKESMKVVIDHKYTDCLGLNPSSATVSCVKVHGQCNFSEHFSPVKWAQT